MKKGQKTLVSSVAALASVAGIIAPSAAFAATLTPAQQDAENYVSYAEKTANFYDFNMAFAKVLALPSAQQGVYLARLSAIEGKAKTDDVKLVLTTMDSLAANKDLNNFYKVFDLVNKVTDTKNKQYLQNELNTWGHASVFTPDVVAATDAIIKAWTTKDPADVAAAQVLTSKVANAGSLAWCNDQISQVQATMPVSVTSVTVLNGKQLLVKFNKAVSTSANTSTNYVLTGTSTYSVASAALQSDKQTVILTLNTAVANNTTASFGVSVSGIASATDSTKVIPVFTTVVTVKDTAAATVTGVDSITSGATASSITVNFSEPVTNGGIIIDGGSTSYVASGKSTTISGLALDSSKTHTIEVVNLVDASGNNNAYQSTTFSITKDTVAPVISSITGQSDSAILVTFSKAMSVLPTVKVKDETYTDFGNPAINAVSGDTTGTKYLVTFTNTGLYDNKNSRNLTVVFDGTTPSSVDTLGNAFADVIKTVTLTKDTAAPYVTGATVQKNSSGTPISFTLQFNKVITNNSGSLTVVDQNGLLQSTAVGSASLGSDNQSLVYTVTGLTGKISVSVPAAVAKDTALTPNSSLAYNTVIDLGTPATSVGSFSLLDSNITVSGKVITVVYPTAVKGGAVSGSATDLANYSLAGKSLPAGTSITLNATSQTVGGTSYAAQCVATITLPAGSITADTAAAIFRVNNIIGLNGSVGSAYLGTVTIDDNTAPVLQTAKVLDTHSIILTYSEGMAALTSADGSAEFTVKVNGSALTTADLKVDSVPGYSNELKISFAGETLDLTKTITVGTTSGTVVTDSSNAVNAQAETTVTATK